MAFKMKGSTHYGKGNSSPAKAYGKPSPAKDYSVNKGSHNHPHGDSPNKFLGGMLKKIGGAAKGMLKGKDGKFGIGDVGRLALGPLGAAGGAAGLFMKDSPAKAVKKPKVTSKMVKNPDGSYTETKSDGKRTASSTYKKSKRAGAKDVYKNEHGQTRQITSKPPTKMVGTIGRAIKTGAKKVNDKIKAYEKKKMDEALMRGSRDTELRSR